MITVSRETAIKIKDFGRIKGCNFRYIKVSATVPDGKGRSKRGTGMQLKYGKGSGLPAPTAQEILDELPSHLYSSIESEYRSYQRGVSKEHYLSINKQSDGSYICFYIFSLEGSVRESFYLGEQMKKYDTLVESLAELRIRCKENGHLD